MSSSRWGQKWADVEEDDQIMSPSNKTRFETETDAQGIKTVIEYIERDGRSYKVTRKVKVRTVVKKVSLAIQARAHIPCFGKHMTADGKTKKEGSDDPEEGGSRVTQSPEDVQIEVPKRVGAAVSNEGKSAEDKFLEESLNACEGMTKKTTSWTDALKIKKQEDELKDPEVVGTEEKKEEGGKGGLERKTGAYVPPSMRGKDGKGDGKGEKGRQEETSLRVTNLCDDCRDGDLNELFGQFGRLQRVFLGKHMDTGQCKGWAFVTYYNREDAERARQKLHGHGYDNLILQVKWAEKRSD